MPVLYKKRKTSDINEGTELFFSIVHHSVDRLAALLPWWKNQKIEILLNKGCFNFKQSKIDLVGSLKKTNKNNLYLFRVHITSTRFLLTYVSHLQRYYLKKYSFIFS